MTTVKRRTTPLDMGKVVRDFADFRKAKNAESVAKTVHERLRDRALMPLLERFGKPHGEHGQHLAIELPEDVDGFVRLVRRTNMREEFDLDAAEVLVESKGILRECQTVSVRMDGIPATELEKLRKAIEAAGLEQYAPVLVDVRLDQDKVYAAHARKLIDADELDKLIVSTPTYSFFPERA